MFDFQYSGKASCCKDLAYFFICNIEYEKDEKALMKVYHTALKMYLNEKWHEKAPSFERLNVVLIICFADLGR